MEYYRRCNVCGQINCYTDIDLINNEQQKKLSGLTALASLTNAFIGTKYDMYEMNKISDKANDKIVNYKKCNKCSSIDTILVTKKYAQFSNKENYEIQKLNENAKNYFEKQDYENAFCFAYIASLENDEFLDTKNFLLLYNIKSIDEIKNVIINYFHNQHFINLFNRLNKDLQNELLKIYNLNARKVIKEKVSEMIKSNLDKVDMKELKDIKKMLEDYNLTTEKGYQILNEQIESREKQKKYKRILVKSLCIITLVVILAILIFKVTEYNNRDETGAVNEHAATVTITYHDSEMN